MGKLVLGDLQNILKNDGRDSMNCKASLF